MQSDMENLVKQLAERRDLTDEQFCALLAADAWDAELFEAADRVRRARYGADVYILSLIHI